MMLPTLRVAQRALAIRHGLSGVYADVLTPEVLRVLAALAPLDVRRVELMRARMARRSQRQREGLRLEFMDPGVRIPGSDLCVADARAGRFSGAEIPADLQRQWVQGTGPSARSGVPPEQSLRNVAYALLSGADGWMFDGEDALGQTGNLALDSQRNLKLAIAADPSFLNVAQGVAREMNTWSLEFLKRPIVADWRAQLDFTTKLFRPRGLHLDDRSVQWTDGAGFSASIVDCALYVVNNYRQLLAAGSSIALYLPKIQTAEEATLWHQILHELELQLGLQRDEIKVYVLVEQLEASFQLMEIRAALAGRFLGFNTGRWDYIHSVADALAGHSGAVHPNIGAVTMLYPYMQSYEDRVRRAVNTPDAQGRCALWQGGMEPNIPVGSKRGVAAGLEHAVQGAIREQAAGASGKWVAHWKMVHVVRAVWERAGAINQLGRAFPPLTYSRADAEALVALEPGPRNVRGARDLISVALQYANAFGQGMQAAALKPADHFANEDVLYLMEDMATGEIRAGILWEWLHKAAQLTEDDDATGVQRGDRFTRELFERLFAQEYEKLLDAADRHVRDASKHTTLPLAAMALQTYVESSTKAPWFIDLLNLNLDNADHAEALRRVCAYYRELEAHASRATQNVDWSQSGPGSTL